MSSGAPAAQDRAPAQTWTGDRLGFGQGVVVVGGEGGGFILLELRLVYVGVGFCVDRLSFFGRGWAWH